VPSGNALIARPGQSVEMPRLKVLSGPRKAHPVDLARAITADEAIRTLRELPRLKTDALVALEHLQSEEPA
jgi:hypothetical protein